MHVLDLVTDWYTRSKQHKI